MSSTRQDEEPKKIRRVIVGSTGGLSDKQLEEIRRGPLSDAGTNWKRKKEEQEIPEPRDSDYPDGEGASGILIP